MWNIGVKSAIGLTATERQRAQMVKAAIRLDLAWVSEYARSSRIAIFIPGFTFIETFRMASMKLAIRLGDKRFSELHTSGAKE